MQTPLNSQRPDKVKIYAIVGVILVVTFFVSYFGQEIDAATPSEFLSHLASRDFLSWHRWRPLSFDEAGWVWKADDDEIVTDLGFDDLIEIY